jgi:hypothetical protein
MPGLLFPLGLAALVALALPLIIHLARRTDERPTDFAALRWLSPRPKPQSRPRFDEWPLLVTRLLLLALLALWLARPVLNGSADDTSWVAVVPGVAAEQAQTLIARGAEGHWLAPGFPDLDTPPPPGPVPVASLLRQVDAELPARARLSLLVPATIEGADAERPRLSRAVDWQVVPAAGNGTAPATRPASVKPLVLAVRFADDHAGGVRYLRAAAAAWQPAARFDAASVTAPLPPPSATLVWLASGPLPEPVRVWASKGGTVLAASDASVDLAKAGVTLWRNAVGAPLIEGAAIGRGRLLRFTQPLTPAAMPELVETAFPAGLRAALIAPAPEPARVAARDYAPLVGKMGRAVIPARDLQPWLALLIGGLFLVERWLATRARRAVAP